MNIQITYDLFADLLIYFGVSTDPEPTEYRRQQIHDALALKVQAMNNRVNYKQGLGYAKQSVVSNPIPCNTNSDLEQIKLDVLYEQREFESYLLSIGFNQHGIDETINRLKSNTADMEDLNAWHRYKQQQRNTPA